MFMVCLYIRQVRLPAGLTDSLLDSWESCLNTEKAKLCSYLFFARPSSFTSVFADRLVTFKAVPYLSDLVIFITAIAELIH